MNRWTPIFSHDTFSVYQLRSLFPDIEICFLKREWLSTFEKMSFLFFVSQIEDHLILFLYVFPDVPHDSQLFKVLWEAEDFAIIVFSTLEEESHLVYSTFFDKEQSLSTISEMAWCELLYSFASYYIISLDISTEIRLIVIKK